MQIDDVDVPPHAKVIVVAIFIFVVVVVVGGFLVLVFEEIDIVAVMAGSGRVRV